MQMCFQIKRNFGHLQVSREDQSHNTIAFQNNPSEKPTQSRKQRHSDESDLQVENGCRNAADDQVRKVQLHRMFQ